MWQILKILKLIVLKSGPAKTGPARPVPMPMCTYISTYIRICIFATVVHTAVGSICS